MAPSSFPPSPACGWGVGGGKVGHPQTPYTQPPPTGNSDAVSIPDGDHTLPGPPTGLQNALGTTPETPHVAQPRREGSCALEAKPQNEEPGAHTWTSIQTARAESCPLSLSHRLSEQDRPRLSKTLKTNHRRAGKIRPHTALGQGQSAAERGTLMAAPR